MVAMVAMVQTIEIMLFSRLFYAVYAAIAKRLGRAWACQCCACSIGLIYSMWHERFTIGHRRDHHNGVDRRGYCVDLVHGHNGHRDSERDRPGCSSRGRGCCFTTSGKWPVTAQSDLKLPCQFQVTIVASVCV